MTARSVDTVLFDLDDTLVTYSRSTPDVLAEAFDRVGVDAFFPATAYFERYQEFLRDADSTPDLRRNCFAAIAADRGRDPALGRAVADVFNDLRADSTVELLPGAPDVLDTLSTEHRLGVVTNGPPDVQAPKLRQSGIDDWFDTVVYAGYDTEPKPHPDPFDHALSALDGTPEAAVHVGNSLESDVAGAKAAGVGSVWIPAYEETCAVDPDYRIDSLFDLATPPWR